MYCLACYGLTQTPREVIVINVDEGEALVTWEECGLCIGLGSLPENHPALWTWTPDPHIRALQKRLQGMFRYYLDITFT